MKAAWLYTVVGTAAYLGMSTEEFQALIDQGEVPVVPASSETLIHEADLEAYLKRQSIEPPAERRTFSTHD